MSKLAGCIWVEGANLHYIDNAGSEYYITGLDDGLTSGLAGCIWMEYAAGAGRLCWVDESQHRRYRVPGSTIAVTGALEGSLWIEGSSLKWTYSSSGILKKTQSAPAGVHYVGP